MINYQWQFLELFAKDNNLVAVRYLLSGTNKNVTVQSEGNHTFADGTVSKPLSEIVESDLIQWIEKDTTQDDVNPIKLAIESQLNSLETSKKVDFPWLAGTFTIE
jgi:hypothetical protein